MTVSKKLTERVLKRIFAAEDDQNPNVSLPEDQKGEGADRNRDVSFKQTQSQPVDLNVISRIYYFSAPPGKKISFGQLYSILSGNAEGVNDNDKKELYNNLQGGSAPYAGDYFKWIGVAVLLQDPSDTAKKVSYLYYLNDWGTLDTARTRIAKTNQTDFDPPDAVEAARKFELFNTIQDPRGAVNDMVVIATGTGAIFSSSVPSDNVVNRLLIEKPESLVQNRIQPNDFNPEGVLNSQYRIRVVGAGAGGAELRNIDGTSSTRDEIGPNQYGYYPGGEQAFKKLIAVSNYSLEPQEEKPEEQGAPQQSLKDMEEQQEDRFKPVDEQKRTTKREVDLHTTQASEVESYIKEINKDDPNVNQYTGDNSVMQDLVRLQHKKMKIRRQAGDKSIDISLPAKADAVKKGIEALKEMEDSVKDLEKKTKGTDIQMSVVQKLSSENDKESQTIDLQIPSTAPATDQAGKALQNLSKSLQEFDKSKKNLEQSTGTKIQTTPGVSSGMSKYSSDLIDKVVNRFLDN